MTISEIKKQLARVDTISFQLPNGAFIPEHFHVTEIGAVTRHFIDCGGTERLEKIANFQLWNANDLEHRLQPKKLLNIIALSEKKLHIGDWEIEVEYQSDTIGKYGLAYDGTRFQLTAMHTACLAKDSCGIASADQGLAVSGNVTENKTCCAPGGGCC